jgi:hypothetical protein
MLSMDALYRNFALAIARIFYSSVCHFDKTSQNIDQSHRGFDSGNKHYQLFGLT